MKKSLGRKTRVVGTYDAEGKANVMTAAPGSSDARRASASRTGNLPESPLWATDQPAIYYWSAEAHSEAEGLFVAYNGTVNATRKTTGNPRHGYRCVKEPEVP